MNTGALSSANPSRRERPSRQPVEAAPLDPRRAPAHALARELKSHGRMPYRDTGAALESKLAFLLDARRELDASIAETRRELEPYRSARRRSRVRTALRVVIVAAGLAPFLCVIAAAFLPRCGGCLRPLPCWGGASRVDSTRTDARTVAGAVEMYLAENPGGKCPDVDALLEGGFLNPYTRTRDVWDQPFLIECEGTDITVHSAGPDGQHGTDDDIQ